MRESSEEEYMGEYTEKQRAKLHETIMTALLEKNPKWYEAVMLVCLMEYPQEEAARKWDEERRLLMFYCTGQESGSKRHLVWNTKS